MLIIYSYVFDYLFVGVLWHALVEHYLFVRRSFFILSQLHLYVYVVEIIIIFICL